MSDKQGIPLLKPFSSSKQKEEADSSSDEEEETSPFKPSSDLNESPSKLHRYCPVWKRWLLTAMIIIGLAVILLVITLPIILREHSNTPPSKEFFFGEVYKSPHDPRSYSYLKLSNNLRVLLISDNETQLSAAAMDVAVGSFSDPKDYNGLAHFCEHMLFYGSQKYPQENAYSGFLSRHGGYDNAYTSIQNTNYHFQVNSEYLSQALDRFAQFFISPILVQDGVSREVNAVDAEHRKNLQNDGWRLWQLKKHISNPYHPMSQFNTGDLSTLNKPGLLEELKKFYNSHYSANQMQLVIYGREDIPTLTQYAKNMFSAIVNKNIERSRFDNTSFSSPYNRKIIYYLPVANTNSLSIYWQVTPLRQKYREKVSSILSQLLGHEGHGSALNYLKTQQWATSLSAGTDVSTDTYSIIEIDITLTQKGLANTSKVIAAVMQYIKLLDGLSNDEWAQQWKDFVDISFVNFNYSVKTNPDSYASQLASDMRIITDPNDFLGAPQRFIYNHTLLKQVVSSLSPSTPIIFLGSKNLSNPQVANIDLPLPSRLSQTEPIYGTQYEVIKISDSLISNWSNSQVPGLSLPPPNQFIPRNFDILPTNTVTSLPVNITDETLNGTSIWWQQDGQFLKPKLNINCDIHTSEDNKDSYNYDPKWAALSSLYTSVISTIINPELYPATLVGSSASIQSTSNGISISISTYSDSTVVNRIIKAIVSAMTNYSAITNKDIYSLSLVSLTEALTNYNYTALPYHYTYQYIQSIVMERPSWKYWQLLQILKDPSITPDELYNHSASIFNSSTLLCLVHGNVNQSQALRYGKSIHHIIQFPSSISPKGGFTTRRLPLSAGNYSVIVPALNPNDINSVVNVMFQIGNVCELPSPTCIPTCNCSDSSLKTRVVASLLTLQIKQSCFDVLRTKQQLGYVAYCTLRINENIASFQVLVQSGTQNISLVLDRIDQFLIDSEQNLTDFLSSSQKLDNLKKVYRNILARKDLTLSEATSRLWYQLSSGFEQYNYRAQLNHTLNQITASDITNFYTKYILSSVTYKKLVIGVHGKDKEENFNDNFTHDIDYTQINPRAVSYP